MDTMKIDNSNVREDLIWDDGVGKNMSGGLESSRLVIVS
jgi:hypothetical protein